MRFGVAALLTRLGLRFSMASIAGRYEESVADRRHGGRVDLREDGACEGDEREG